MQKQARHKIVIMGCGNVAWHLAKQISSLKKYELFVYNHQPNNMLNDFKTNLNCNVASNLNKIINDAEFYFICVGDKFISTVAKKIKITKGIVIHTSGSLKINELGGHKNAAVFYPLQTFSKQDKINWEETPIIIEAKNAVVKNKLNTFAKQFSNDVNFLNYNARLKLHLAAVLVNNFTNALYVAANDLISENKKSKLLLPLIKQTGLKLNNLDARAAQTGPAKRKDETVMKKHLKLLSGNDDLKKIYKQMSNLIIKQQTKKHA
ncbi:MAG: DUF2520 domain-containing protein [Bacteroidia bacterium]|nr:DUF2520 domain-containing protein [Bacteroidia bacterium]